MTSDITTGITIGMTLDLIMGTIAGKDEIAALEWERPEGEEYRLPPPARPTINTWDQGKERLSDFRPL